MQIFVKIQNDGEIDPRAFQLVGASTKRDDDSKIGFFGSGNKYAIAMLLRKNIYFRVFSGDKEIVFGKKNIKFRDQEYEIITINGVETSLTTEMGPQWEEWFAIREFYCNSLDEGGATIGVSDKIEPESGKTTIYIEKTLELGKFFSNIKRYILAGKRNYLDLVDTHYSGRVMCLPPFKNEFICYRKGIRITENNSTPALYSYNFEKIEINESRIVKNSSDIYIRIAKFLAYTKNKDIILNLIDNWKGNAEENANWWYISGFSETWYELLRGKRVYPEKYAIKSGDKVMKNQSYILPNDLAEKIAEYMPEVDVVGMSDGEKYKEIEGTASQLQKIHKAMTEVEKIGYKVNKPVKIGVFYQDDVVACFDKKKNQIVFAQKYINGNTDGEIENTLMEEHFHSMGYSDASREFESFLIEELKTTKRELLGS